MPQSSSPSSDHRGRSPVGHHWNPVAHLRPFVPKQSSLPASRRFLLCDRSQRSVPQLQMQSSFSYSPSSFFLMFKFLGSAKPVVGAPAIPIYTIAKNLTNVKFFAF